MEETKITYLGINEHKLLRTIEIYIDKKWIGDISYLRKILDYDVKKGDVLDTYIWNSILEKFPNSQKRNEEIFVLETLEARRKNLRKNSKKNFVVRITPDVSSPLTINQINNIPSIGYNYIFELHIATSEEKFLNRMIYDIEVLVPDKKEVQDLYDTLIPFSMEITPPITPVKNKPL